MAINPDNITTIRVDQLATATLNVGNEFAHSQGSELKKATIQDLVDIVSTAVGAGSGVGFLPISVTDGQQLPSVPTDPSFFLCGPGTYLNVNGFPDVVCTDELNAVMSLTDHWQLSVGIPITPDLPSIGISQSVNSGTIDKAPSENAVYNFVYNYVASQILKSSLGYFDYNDLATQTTPISVPSNTQTLLTNDTLGPNTDETQPPFGVTSVWDSNEFNFSQLSIGDTVDIRVHLKTTTSANNQLYHIDMKAGIGSASEFENRIFSAYVKTSAVDEQTFITTFYIGNADIRDYPAQLFITSVGNTATVKVVGWFVRVFRKSVNIVDIVVAEEAPIDGQTYGRKDAEWVEVTGGGGGIPDAPNDANAYVRSALAWAIGYTKTAIDTLLGNKVDKITTIVGATKTKVTYNTQGQVTSGADATTADIADSVNKRYQTDAQETVNDATSSIQTQLNGKVNNTGTETIAGAKTFSSNISIPATGTPLILSVSSGGAVSGLDTTTYPSLTELALVKGVTGSAIQTQINSKQATLTETNLGAIVKALTAKTTPIGADAFLISDSADSDKAKEVSYTNLTATLKAYFDTIYAGSTNTFKRILNSTVETTPVTGTLTETLLYSAPVIAGGTYAFDDYFNFQMTFRKNGVSETSCTYRIKVSNTNNYATASLLATWQSQRFNTVIERKNLFFKANGTLNSGILTTAVSQTDLTNVTNAVTSLSVTPANDIYLFISVQLATITEDVRMTAIRLTN